MLATRGLGRRAASGLLLATAGLGFAAAVAPPTPPSGIDEPTTVQIVDRSATSVEVSVVDASSVISVDVHSVEVAEEITEASALERTDVEIELVPDTTVTVMMSDTVDLLDDPTTTLSIRDLGDPEVIVVEEYSVDIAEETSVTRQVEP